MVPDAKGELASTSERRGLLVLTTLARRLSSASTGEQLHVSDNCSAPFHLPERCFSWDKLKIWGTICAAAGLLRVAGRATISARRLRVGSFISPSAEADRVAASFSVPVLHGTLPHPRVQQELATSSMLLRVGEWLSPKALAIFAGPVRPSGVFAAILRSADGAYLPASSSARRSEGRSFKSSSFASMPEIKDSSTLAIVQLYTRGMYLPDLSRHPGARPQQLDC